MIKTLFLSLKKRSKVKIVCSYVKKGNLYWIEDSPFFVFCFAFVSGFPFATIYESQDFHPLHRLSDISRAITAEGSPLLIASNRTQTGSPWFPSASR